MKVFKLEIVTPEQQIFSGDVQSVQVPGVQGSFQVLHNHAPIISTLDQGKIKIVPENGQEETLSMHGGVIEVLKNKVIILAEKIVEN